MATNVDLAVKAGSLAETSRQYAIGAEQISGNNIFNWNPTGDPTIKPTPNGSYNAELVKQLSPAMTEKMRTLYPTP